ncbi:MAG: hypothetical protein GTN78_26230 [Gemmatimonadales bacterium]|nr:hypothetical protein [Gemmatimonadales bacterium]
MSDLVKRLKDHTCCHPCVRCEAADAIEAQAAEIRGYRYMISCEMYDEHYTGKPCAGVKDDEAWKLRHRCLTCQIAQKADEIERLRALGEGK